MFALSLLIALALSSFAALWLIWGLPGLLELTYSLADFCASLFVRCLELSAVSKLIFLWSGGALLGSGLIYATVNGAANLIKANRAISALPLNDRGGKVVLIRDDSGRAAFTHGLLRPRIYISTGLINALEQSELKGVFLHELNHMRNYDPLRFFLLNLLKDAFYYIPVIKDLAVFARIMKEHEADDAAAKALGEPLSLASALVKVASHNRSRSFATASFTGRDPVTARIKRLIEGGETKPGITARAAAVSIIAFAFISISFSMPLYAGTKAEACTTRHCETHLNKIEGCKAHCETHRHH